jgi:uncharacterized protein (TIGR02246 family)
MSVSESAKVPATGEVVAITQAIMQRLERAWNSGDGVAFGEPFSTDATFVAIRGDLHAGRDAIAEGHEQILHTIYAGSTIRYQVLQARELDDRVILAHVQCTMNTPSGPLAGEHASTITVVLIKRDDRYEIVAYHNTLITG